jgi:hypothetical protein
MPYTINGTNQDFAAPVVMNDTTFVPLANVADAVGAITEWDNMAKIASVELDALTVRVQADNPNVETPSGTVQLQAAPYLDNGVLWVPVRFFERALNCTIAVNGDNVQIDRRF